MKSRWKSSGVIDPDREYLALASSIPAKKMSSTWKMFRGSRAIRRQLADTEGLIGFSLLAEPATKRYATLSLWIDEEALAKFTARSPHREIMSDLAPEVHETKFVKWTVSGADGRPSWSEALKRLR